MTVSTRPPILDRLSALADATRSRILLVLARHELTVSELCSVLQLPQSTVSRHLKVLADGDWVVSRKNGTRHLYRFEPDGLDSSARGLWTLARTEVALTPGASEDRRRFAGVLGERRQRSREFFASAAGQWDRMRDGLFGSESHAQSLLALLPGDWVVADLGCGTGPVAEALAPFVRRVIAIDDSPAMLEAAGERLAGSANVELRRGELEELPLDDSVADAVTLVLALHHVAEPLTVLREVVRVLRPGGRLLLVDMLPHERHEYRHEMGHVWMGFSEDQIARLFTEAGLRDVEVRDLPAQVSARGPSLFAATAMRDSSPVEPGNQRNTETKNEQPPRGVTE